MNGQQAVDAAYPAVRPEAVSATAILKGPRGVTEDFSKATHPLFSRMMASEHESRTLAALRDVLLPKLISGEIRVLVADRNEEENYG